MMSNRPLVLVVDDEAILRELAAAAVEEAGCVALQAGSADEALERLRTCPDVALMI